MKARFSTKCSVCDALIEKGKENRKLIKKLDLSWDRFAKDMNKTLEKIVKER